MIGIYKITNTLNSHSYIGQSVNIERRWREHVQAAQRNDTCTIHKAMRKYGCNNFTFEVIEYCGADELNELETYYIQKYNTLIPNGYNWQLGGNTSSLEATQQVKQIRHLLMTTSLTHEEIARQTQVSRRTVIRINLGDVWFDNQFTYPLRPKLTSINPTCKCVDCGCQVSKGAIRCPACSAKHQQHCDRPSAEQLEHELSTSSFVAVGRKYGVSDNTIRNWCRKYGMSTKSKDYKK